MAERVVSLHRGQEQARQDARRIALAFSGRVVRCRVTPMDLTRKPIEAICFDWGRDDAERDEPLRAERLPRPYDAIYHRGYNEGKRLARRGRKP